MDKLLHEIEKDFSAIKFVSGDIFSWSPKNRLITYRLNKTQDVWAFFHELGHAALNHLSYASDFELLKLEVAAWAKACQLAQKYGYEINPEHIENCLDTYREWLHRRSTCPSCYSRSLQSSPTEYRCFNCHASWKVTASRFCRPYRQIKLANKKPLEESDPQATFV